MSISRKIIEVKTTTTKHGVRPDIDLELGFNYKVLEYSADKSSAIVEIWASDVAELKPTERKNASAFGQFISSLAQKQSFIRLHPTHPKSPAIIGRISRGNTLEDTVVFDEG